MAAYYEHDGKNIPYTPGSAVLAGAVVVQADVVGIATHPIAANELGALAIEGVFRVPKTVGTGAAIAVGTILYWDVADGVAKADAEAGANKQIGKAILAATDSDTHVQVKLTH